MTLTHLRAHPLFDLGRSAAFSGRSVSAFFARRKVV
jgi:hypothetical protein